MTQPRRGRRPAFTREQIVEAAVALLDKKGESALTLRALAHELRCGVGSLYWYVSSRNELLDRATNAVLAGVVEQTADLPDDPYEAWRVLAQALYVSMKRHPWIGAFLMRDTAMQPSSLVLYDRVGRQSQKLALSTRQRFHAVSAIMGYVIGVGAEMREPPPGVLAGEIDPEEALEAYADSWRALDADEFPYLHEVVDEFAHHHDEDQFRSGLELILAGIKAQVGR